MVVAELPRHTWVMGRGEVHSRALMEELVRGAVPAADVVGRAVVLDVAAPAETGQADVQRRPGSWSRSLPMSLPSLPLSPHRGLPGCGAGVACRGYSPLPGQGSSRV
jgi:hypothetical protein